MSRLAAALHSPENILAALEPEISIDWTASSSEDIDDCSSNDTSSMSNLGFSRTRLPDLSDVSIATISCCLSASKVSSNTLMYRRNTDILLRGAVKRRPQPTDTIKESALRDDASTLASPIAMADGLLWLSPPSWYALPNSVMVSQNLS